MSTSKLKDCLPELDGQTLDFIFDHVYDIFGMPGENQALEAGKLFDLLKILKALQGFNYHHRLNEIRDLYRFASAPPRYRPKLEFGRIDPLASDAAIRQRFV